MRSMTDKIVPNNVPKIQAVYFCMRVLTVLVPECVAKVPV